MTKRRKPAEPQSRPSQCVGCGGTAAGYNYEAPSCYSCKTFFRRAVLKEKVPAVCLKNGMCEKNASLRPCRKCRFDRCVSGGMNVKLIKPESNLAEHGIERDEEILNEKPSTSASTVVSSPLADCEQLVSKKKARRKQILPVAEESSSQELVPSDPYTESRANELQEMRLHQPVQMELMLDRMMEDLLTIELAYHNLRISTYTPTPLTLLSVDELVPGPSKLGANFEPMCAQAYDPVSVRLIPEEVFIKHRIPIDFSDFDYSTKKLWVFQDIVYAIEYIKALSVFTLLSESSKLVLLSSAIICSNFTSAYFSYKQRSDRTCYPDGGTMSWNKELQEESPDSTRFHTALIALIREYDLDTREYALLKVIVACNPLLDGLCPGDAKLLQLEKERYTKALLSYVLAKRGVKEGPTYFAKLLSIVFVVTKLTAWQKSQHILILAMGLDSHRSPFLEAIFHSH